MTDKFEDLLKERDRFVERIRDASRRASTEADKAATDDPRELLSRYMARLQEANRAKGEAVERYDEEIGYYASLVSEIEKTLAAGRDTAAAKSAADEGANEDEEGTSTEAPPDDSQTKKATVRGRKADRGAKPRDA